MEYCWEQGHLWTNYNLKFESVAQESIAIVTESEVENEVDLWPQ